MHKPILYTENQPEKGENGLYPYVLHTEDKICGFFGKYFFLSNGKKCEIQDVYAPNISYPYSENAYQASKFESVEIRQIFQQINYRQAIELAWELREHIKANWEALKLGEMKRVLFQKFQDNTLKNNLLETGNKYLEETNHWKDTFWGVCEGVGENHLGKILMEIRGNI
jgi:hypothetical protein